MTTTTPFLRTRLLIIIFSSLICLLEIVAPLEYIFGYLYIVPILLAACELGINGTSVVKRVAWTSRVTKITMFLTLFDFVISKNLNGVNFVELPISIIVNRLSVVLLLLLTDWLIERNLRYVDEIYAKQDQITRYQSELSTRIQIDRMHEDFVYTLTHDLKTPLLGAIQTIEYFHKEKFGLINSMQAQVLAKMFRSQLRLLELVETMLDVYRNDTEGLVLQSQPINLDKIAKESIDTVATLGLERQIRLNLKCNNLGVQRLQLIGDPLQLSRVFTNLLSNAIYHSPHSGKIDIKVEHHSFYYTVQVIDRGRGIASADLPWIFDRFYQAKDGLKGSGLGLYLSRQIVEAHGGEIWAESVLPSGAKLCFRLPVKV